jgi:DNA-binding CsgD family transcriptional regulator
MVWLAIDARDPPGKVLSTCNMKRIILTLHAKADEEVYQEHGLQAKRQVQISRMTIEAKDQGALLTQEDLSRILGVDVKTVRRDIALLKKNKIIIPTRGQQKDIGPGVTHREIAVKLFLEGKEPLEISRQIKHSLKAVERYVDTFCRVVYCQNQVHNTLQTALIIGISVSQISTYLAIKDEYIKKPAYQNRLEMIESKGKAYWDQIDFKKNALQQERRKK